MLFAYLVKLLRLFPVLSIRLLSVLFQLMLFYLLQPIVHSIKHAAPNSIQSYIFSAFFLNISTISYIFLEYFCYKLHFT